MRQVRVRGAGKEEFGQAITDNAGAARGEGHPLATLANLAEDVRVPQSQLAKQKESVVAVGQFLLGPRIKIRLTSTCSALQYLFRVGPRLSPGPLR
jgi:hypothetical protein